MTNKCYILNSDIMKNELTKKDYFKIFLLYGIVYATIPIIIAEITWDIILGGIGFKVGLCRDLVESFFRAALIEEIFKFLGFMGANKKYQFKNEKEYMIGAGMIGLAYGIIEKIATGNGFSIVLGIIFPMHLLWQMNQGRHYYKYKIAKEENNIKVAKKELFMATIFIFLMHGCWDAIISIISHLAAEANNINANMIGGILLILIIIIGIIYVVISIKKIRKVLKNNKKSDGNKTITNKKDMR